MSLPMKERRLGGNFGNSKQTNKACIGKLGFVAFMELIPSFGRFPFLSFSSPTADNINRQHYHLSSINIEKVTIG